MLYTHYHLSYCIFLCKNQAHVCMPDSTHLQKQVPVVLSSTFRTHLSGSISLIRLRPINILSCSQTIPLSACNTLYNIHTCRVVMSILDKRTQYSVLLLRNTCIKSTNGTNCQVPIIFSGCWTLFAQTVSPTKRRCGMAPK